MRVGARELNEKERAMPLVAFAGALGGLAVVRWAYKTAVRINRELEDARRAGSPKLPSQTKFRRCGKTL